MATIFKAAPGSHISNNDATRYGERIQELIERGEIVTPKVVLEDAKSLESPLHDYFDWDDSVAAQRHRLHQSSYLIRSVHIVIKRDKDKNEESTRAFHPVTVKVKKNEHEEMERGYKTAVEIFSNEELRGQLVERAMRELKTWRRKYKQYSELDDIIAAITTVVEVAE